MLATADHTTHPAFRDAERALALADAGANPTYALSISTSPAESAESFSNARWDARLDNFRTLGATARIRDTRRREIKAAANKVAPKPREIACYGGVQGILNDRVLGSDEQLRRIRLWDEWEPRHQAALKAAGWTDQDEAMADSSDDELSDALLDAEGDLMATPAPTIEALSVKLTNLLVDECGPMVGDDPEDPRFISAVLASEDYAARMLAGCVQDALRLAGVESPIATARPFDPASIFEMAAREGFDIFTDSRCSDAAPALGLLNVAAPENAFPSDELSRTTANLMPVERRVVCREIHRRREAEVA